MIHSPNHHTWRRAFSWTLIAIYFIGVSILIPYALGYRFSLERGVFVYAGSVTLKVNISNVDIYLDGELLPDKRRNFINNSYHITGLEPGEHRITLSAEGYNTWEKNITVKSGRSTEFWTINLTRKDYPRTKITTTAMPFYIAPNGNIATSKEIEIAQIDTNNSNSSNQTSTKTQSQILIINPENKTESLVWQDDFAQIDTSHNMEWSPSGKFLLAPIIKTNKENQQLVTAAQKPKNPTESTKENKTENLSDIVIIDTEAEKNQTYINVSALLPNLKNIKTIRWSPQNKDVLVIFAGDTLYNLPITTGLLTTKTTDQITNLRKVITNVNAFTIANDKFYILSSDNIIYGSDNIRDDNVTIEQITTTTFEGSAKNAELFVYNDNQIAIIDKLAQLWLLNNQDIDTEATFEKIAENVNSVHFSGDGKKLLWWSDTQISVLFLRKQKAQPAREIGEVINITRLTQPVTNVQWTLNDTHILYSVSNKINLAAIDQRGGQSITTITTADTNSPVRINQNQIYFIQNKTLVSIPFITKTGLF